MSVPGICVSGFCFIQESNFPGTENVATTSTNVPSSSPNVPTGTSVERSRSVTLPGSTCNEVTRDTRVLLSFQYDHLKHYTTVCYRITLMERSRFYVLIRHFHIYRFEPSKEIVSHLHSILEHSNIQIKKGGSTGQILHTLVHKNTGTFTGTFSKHYSMQNDGKRRRPSK